MTYTNDFDLGFMVTCSIRETMYFEDCHKDVFRLSGEDKFELDDIGAKFCWFFDHETIKPVGEIIYIDVDKMRIILRANEKSDFGLNYFSGKRAAYVYRTTVLPEYRGRGIGKCLKKYAMEDMKNEGYEYCCGHSRHGISSLLNKSLGAIFLKKYDNWFDTGEPYFLYKIKL